MDLQPHPDDHEAKMARADLFKLAQYSFKLFKMIHEDMELEGWVQAKITKSADYIASVYHYMEYEMKFSEYGERLEQSDMYSSMSESQQRALTNMLTEAKATMKKLTAAQAKKLKKKNAKVEEAAKPDFDDGDEEEPMKKAAKEKKVKEGFPTVDDAKKDHEEREKSKGTGKFDKKDTEKGTQYTRKSSTFTDGGDDSDVKKAKKKAKQTDEGVMDTVKAAAKKVGKAVTGGSDEDQRKDLQRKMGVKQTGKKPAPAKEVDESDFGPGRSGPNKNLPGPEYSFSPDTKNYKTPNLDRNASIDDKGYMKDWNKEIVNTTMGPDTRGNQARIGAYTSDGQGQTKYVDRTAPGIINKIKDKLGYDMPDPAYGPRPDETQRLAKRYPAPVKEASKAKKDYDKDGKIESGKDEYLGSKIAAAKKAGKMAEAAKCNHSTKGKSCPVHGLKECGSMAYEGRRG